MSSGQANSSLLSPLDVQHPEWRPLLVLLDTALREAGRATWARFVPPLAHHGRDGRPLLDGAVIDVSATLVGQWVGHIVVTAAAAGTQIEPFASAITNGRLDPLVVFAAAMSQDADRLDELARTVNDDGIRGLAPLIAMPLLHACRRAWAARVPADWSEGFCPICGAWPALAEVRGLGGSRHLRCGRCGGDWQTEWLRCPFCRENDHETVGGLVSEQGEGRHTIDVCHGCRTYVKTITTLSPMRPEDVVVHDLATVVQDLMALEHGYHRPPASERTIAVALKRRPWRLRHLLGL